MTRSLTYRVEKLPLRAPFRISGYVFEHVEVVVATLTSDGCHGRGEAAGVYYLKDDAANIVRQLDDNRAAIEACKSRDELLFILPAGGARNAVDCAMWELEANLSGRPIWELAGLAAPKPLLTTMTVGVNDPTDMAEAARDFSEARAIKIKLEGDLELDIERVQAIRSARPDVWLGVDANQGFTVDKLNLLADAMAEQRVSLIEQPLARGHEADLDGFNSPVPLAADESAVTIEDTETLRGRFDMVNIKLDKCGGLTAALLIAARARKLGLGVMVGNMTGTSLAMAPAAVVGQLCDIVDLDGPLFLQEDRRPSVTYDDGLLRCSQNVWGLAAAA